MNIKFLGHSMTKRKDETTFLGNDSPDTFVDILQEKYSCHDPNNAYYGVGRCSEERILFYLKKMKKMDMAIIFHSMPTFMFCPGFVRDIHKSMLDHHEMDFLMSTKKGVFDVYDTLVNKVPSGTDESKPMPVEEVNTMLQNNRKFFWNADLQMNRHLGALIQIDQYCTVKQIPVIHFVHVQKMLPSWFKFTSGIVDTEIFHMSHIVNSPYFIGYQNSANSINEEGNKIIAEKIIEYIENYDNLKIDGKEL
jgi:hypothetical protein